MSTRKDFIKKVSLVSAGSLVFSNTFTKANSIIEELTIVNNADNEFVLEPLPYAYDALEPFIDKQTIEIHYQKHHRAYVNNLNKAVAEINNNKSLLDLFNEIDRLPVTIRNNAGGHYNHTLYWKLMKPNGGGAPIGKLAEAINANFNSFDDFKKQFAQSALNRFGSGWVWLVKNTDNKLKITTTANQDNPLMNLEEIEIKGNPILALDVWEHAYYLKYQNSRADYISSWWNVINWQTAEEFFRLG